MNVAPVNGAERIRHGCRTLSRIEHPHRTGLRSSRPLGDSGVFTIEQRGCPEIVDSGASRRAWARVNNADDTMRRTMRKVPMRRTIGMLIADGSDGAAIERLTQAATAAGAAVKTIAPRSGGVTLADGSVVPADGHLSSAPSVLFDALVVILSDEGARMLALEGEAIELVREAFGHLKAIAVDPGGEALLKSARVGRDAGVVAVGDTETFMAAARSRQWDRDRTLRSPA
jgi:hypothetical protein